MTTNPIRSGRWRARGVAALAAAVLFTGPAWAGVPEVDAGAQAETSTLAVDPASLAGAPSGGVLGAIGVFVDEVEPNDTTATAQPLTTLPSRVRGNLFRQPFAAANIDVDVYSFTAAANSRVYAATMTNRSSGSTDSELDILASDGTTVIEFDDDDGSMSALSSNVGGVLLPTAGTYYVRVRQGSITSMSGTIRSYDLYVNVVSGTPTPEVEPNNDPAGATPVPASGYVSGVVGAAADSDWFAVTLNAGDTLAVVADVDPERDTPDWNMRMGICCFNNFILVVDGAPAAGDGSPSEAFFMTAATTGTYYVYIDEPLGAGGATFTYNLSVMVIPPKPRTCTVYPGSAGPINDLATTDFTVTVPDARIIGYAALTLNATHAAPGDLDVTLVGSNGNEVFLFDDVGLAAGSAAPQFNLGLEDEAGIPMSLFAVHAGMRYIPEAASTAGPGRFEYFKGMQAQGTWTLRVRDDSATVGGGTLNSWSLVVCDPDPRPACVVPGPGETVEYSSDFETNDGGFTHSGTLDEWERGLPAFAPITTAHSGVNAWKTDLDNTYDASASYDLLSPSIDLTGASGRITLTWWQKFQMEQPTFDRYWVEVRQVGNPASARKVFEWTGATMTRSVGSPLVTVQQSAGWGQVQADISAFAGMMVEVVYHLETDSSVQLTGVAVDDVSVTSCQFVAGAIPAALSVDGGGNNVYEPNETAVVAPTWRNASAAAMALTGTLSNHVGPAGATYAIPDPSASYGTIAAGGQATCSTAGDCYSVSNVMTTRPGTHWDSTADEDVTSPIPVGYTWTLHIGASFTDVPASNTFYRFIETVLHRGVTGGCTADTYCPADSTTREQMAVFVLVSKDQSAPPPPACVAGSEMFLDVPATSPFCRWVEELARRNVVTGCGGGNYCPGSPASREQMAVFVLRTLDPALVPPACVAGSEMFNDVPASSGFCRWIEELARRGVVTGCGGGAYCPSADVTREQMSVFLAATFGLTLYGL